MTERIIVLVPEAPAPATEEAVHESPRLGGGRLRVGVLDNGKGNADHLLKLLMERLEAEVDIEAVLALRKGSVSLAAERDILDRLATESDFVITAMAD